MTRNAICNFGMLLAAPVFLLPVIQDVFGDVSTRSEMLAYQLIIFLFQAYLAWLITYVIRR